MTTIMTEWGGIVLFIALLAGSALSIVYWSLRNGISPMPTSPAAKRCLISLLPSQLEGSIYELGSGWGTLLFPLAEKYPHCKAIGVENSHIPFWASKTLLRFKRLKNVVLLRKDLFDVPLNDARLVVCYLFPGAMTKLKVKFEQELSPGTWVISNTFAVPGWTPVAAVDTGDLYRSKIYLYKR